MNPLLQVKVHLSGEANQVDWAYVPAVHTHQKVHGRNEVYSTQDKSSHQNTTVDDLECNNFNVSCHVLIQALECWCSKRQSLKCRKFQQRGPWPAVHRLLKTLVSWHHHIIGPQWHDDSVSSTKLHSYLHMSVVYCRNHITRVDLSPFELKWGELSPLRKLAVQPIFDSILAEHRVTT